MTRTAKPVKTSLEDVPDTHGEDVPDGKMFRTPMERDVPDTHGDVPDTHGGIRSDVPGPGVQIPLVEMFQTPMVGSVRMFQVQESRYP